MRRSLVLRQPRSPFWYYDFQVNGHRLRGSTNCTRKTEAEAAAAEIYAEAHAAQPGGPKLELTLAEATARYFEERGERAKTADDIARYDRVLLAELGADTPLADLTTGTLAAYVTRRGVRPGKAISVAPKADGGPADMRGKGGGLARSTSAAPSHPFRDRANASINREIGHLRSVVIRARAWGAAVPEIAWRVLWLDEPENVQTILTVETEDALFAALRPDFWALAEFALVTGLRLDNVVSLRWSQVDDDARVMTYRVKSKRPGGKLLIVPITPAVAMILGAERGRHDVFVFTYVCQRNRHDPHAGMLQFKGDRYPFTHDGWRRSWDAARRAAGLPALRFHDLRHTAATRALYTTRNIQTVKDMLGHADIATTLRYTASDVGDVRAAMEGISANFGRTPRLVKRNSSGGEGA